MYKAAVLTISDKCSIGEREDASGKNIIEILKARNYEVAAYEIVADDPAAIKEKLIFYCDKLKLDLILTTGGTGLGPRDFTPEAALKVIHKQVPGIAEAMRVQCLSITNRAMLSRGISGLRENTLIINLPGSVKGAQQSLNSIVDVLPHAFDMILGKIHK